MLCCASIFASTSHSETFVIATLTWVDPKPMNRHGPAALSCFVSSSSGPLTLTVTSGACAEAVDATSSRASGSLTGKTYREQGPRNEISAGARRPYRGNVRGDEVLCLARLAGP